MIATDCLQDTHLSVKLLTTRHGMLVLCLIRWHRSEYRLYSGGPENATAILFQFQAGPTLNYCKRMTGAQLANSLLEMRLTYLQQQQQPQQLV